MEKQLLPNAALKPVYDQAVWLWVYRDFKQSAADRAAERTEIRFGVTSYPQLFLVHPETLAVMTETGRQVDQFLAAVKRAKVAVRGGTETAQAIERAEAEAIELEEKPALAGALKCLEDADIVVRTRALRIVAEKAPEKVVERAQELLAVKNDPFRFEVCRVLKQAGDPRVASTLQALLERPADSRNPNVLRMSAADALGTCGDEGSLPVLRPFATSGEGANSLTFTAVDAVTAIAGRLPKARDAAVEILCAAYPAPSGDDAQEKWARDLRVRLAQRVHAALAKLTGKAVPFPDPYDEAARARLIKGW